MSYKKFSDRELLESYATALEYSGKADKELVAEIDNRGGIAQVKENVAEENVLPDEVNRIYRLVATLYKDDPNPDTIKSSITSAVLETEPLNDIIDAAIIAAERHSKDTAITSKTIIGCVLGVIISSLIGARLWCYSIIQTGKMYYALTAVILIISYFIIRLFTKQSNNNVLVFIATFVSAFIAIPLGGWWVSILIK